MSWISDQSAHFLCSLSMAVVGTYNRSCWWLHRDQYHITSMFSIQLVVQCSFTSIHVHVLAETSSYIYHTIIMSFLNCVTQLWVGNFMIICILLESHKGNSGHVVTPHYSMRPTKINWCFCWMKPNLHGFWWQEFLSWKSWFIFKSKSSLF